MPKKPIDVASDWMAGRLVVTVDLEPADVVTRAGVVRGVHEMCDRVIDLFCGYGVSATWAVAEPANSPAAARLRSLAGIGEIALLGEPSWVGQRAGRGRFARELARRVALAEASGLAVTSLVPRRVLVDDHLDLIVRHGITAVRGVVDAGGISRRPARPHPLDFGLWEVPGSLRLPGERRFVPGGGRGRHARRAIAAAAERLELYHLVVDVPALAARGRAAVRTVAGVLRVATRLRREGKLKVVSLAKLAAELAAGASYCAPQAVLRSAG
jgi:hypothetical protein